MCCKMVQSLRRRIVFVFFLRGFEVDGNADDNDGKMVQSLRRRIVFVFFLGFRSMVMLMIMKARWCSP